MHYTEIISNPVRMRIIHYMVGHEEATTKDIAADMPDVPRRTLYRHINFLVESGFIKVKETREVRGGVERVLINNQEEFLTSMNPNDIMYQFFMNLYFQFAKYNDQHGWNVREAYDNDAIGSGTALIVLDNDETKKLLDEFVEVIKKYEKNHKKKYGDKKVGKIRSISYISSPVDQENT